MRESDVLDEMRDLGLGPAAPTSEVRQRIDLARHQLAVLQDRGLDRREYLRVLAYLAPCFVIEEEVLA